MKWFKRHLSCTLSLILISIAAPLDIVLGTHLSRLVGWVIGILLLIWLLAKLSRWGAK